MARYDEDEDFAPSSAPNIVGAARGLSYTNMRERDLTPPSPPTYVSQAPQLGGTANFGGQTRTLAPEELDRAASRNVVAATRPEEPEYIGGVPNPSYTKPPSEGVSPLVNIPGQIFRFIQSNPNYFRTAPAPTQGTTAETTTTEPATPRGVYTGGFNTYRGESPGGPAGETAASTKLPAPAQQTVAPRNNFVGGGVTFGLTPEIIAATNERARAESAKFLADRENAANANYAASLLQFDPHGFRITGSTPTLADRKAGQPLSALPSSVSSAEMAERNKGLAAATLAQNVPSPDVATREAQLQGTRVAGQESASKLLSGQLLQDKAAQDLQQQRQIAALNQRYLNEDDPAKKAELGKSILTMMGKQPEKYQIIHAKGGTDPNDPTRTLPDQVILFDQASGKYQMLGGQKAMDITTDPRAKSIQQQLASNKISEGEAKKQLAALGYTS